MYFIVVSNANVVVGGFKVVCKDCEYLLRVTFDQNQPLNHISDICKYIDRKTSAWMRAALQIETGKETCLWMLFPPRILILHLWFGCAIHALIIVRLHKQVDFTKGACKNFPIVNSQHFKSQQLCIYSPSADAYLKATQTSTVGAFLWRQICYWKGKKHRQFTSVLRCLCFVNKESYHYWYA